MRASPLPSIKILSFLKKRDYFNGEICICCKKRFYEWETEILNKCDFKELVGKTYNYAPLCWKCSLKAIEERENYYKKRLALLESWKQQIEEWKSKPENARYLMGEALDG